MRTRSTAASATTTWRATRATTSSTATAATISSGRTGADSYYFGVGDGQDAVVGGGAPLAEDRLILGAGITMADVAVAQQGGDLALTLDGSGERISALGYFADALSRLGEIRFADGASWDVATIERKVTISDDMLSGTTGADTLDGGLGNDNIYGGDGNDFLYGGGGFDVLRGGLGIDTYFFGRGDGHTIIDHYESMLEGETLVFGAGITMADVRLTPNSSNLYLTLDGGTTDIVSVMGQYPAQFLLQHVRFDDGSSWDGETLQRKLFESDDYLPGTSGSDSLDGGLGNDNIFSGNGDDFLNGGAGSDWLLGGNGNDVFFFNGASQIDFIGDAGMDAGFDTLRLGTDLTFARVEFANGGELDALTLRLIWPDQAAELRLGGFLNPYEGDRFDMLTIGQRPENHFVHGTAGDDVQAGSDLFDIFLHGAGDDSLSGGAGHDLYLRGFGLDVDTIFDAADAAGGNHLMLGAMSSAVLQLRYEGNFLVLWDGFDDLVRLSGFDAQDVLGGARAVQTFSFSDGVTLSYEQLLERGFDIVGSDHPNGDLLEGTNIHDRMQGGAGGDTLHGNDGNDHLDGGAGNDSLFGWRGSDTYHFGRLSGTDTVLELQADAADVDTLLFDAGITPDDLVVTQDALGNLHIAIAGSTAALRFNAWFNPEIPSHVERFEFQDGTVLSDAVIEAMINDAPVVANAIVDEDAAEDAAFTFTVPANTFADPDPYDSLTYTASLADGSALPSWLNFSSGTFSGTPANGDVGAISVRVTATDEQGLSVSDVFDLTVIEHQRRTDSSSIRSPHQCATEDAPFSFTRGDEHLRRCRCRRNAEATARPARTARRCPCG